MPSYLSRPALLCLLVIWIGLVGYASKMFVGAELGAREHEFDEEVAAIAGGLRQKLDTNEAVLAGFAAFLQAIDSDDAESAVRYAASAMAAYPHIYMLEVARKVPAGESAAFEAAMRAGWRSEFRLKDFAEITGRGKAQAGIHGDTWPILFMHPALPEAAAIYGLRLETVDYLTHSLALAHGSERPVVSPVFDLYEGGSAFILLREIRRKLAAAGNTQSFFGDTLSALLIVRAEALFAREGQPGVAPGLHFSALLAAPAQPRSRLYERLPGGAGDGGRNLLPRFERDLVVASPSQPVVMHFSRQVRWGDLFATQSVAVLFCLGAALLVVPWLVLQHFGVLDREHAEHARSAYQATHDALTGLPNRFLFADRFAQAFVNWQRNGCAFAVMLLDLDRFKQINDQHGHEVGDQVLVEAARRMTRELRSGDTVARYGGDEFLLLAGNQLDAADAIGVAEKLRAAIAEPIETAVGPLGVSCSIGIALCPVHGQNLEILRQAADRAMYAAKRQGRNGVALGAAVDQG